MEREPERSDPVGLIGQDRRRWSSCFAVVAVLSAWFVSTGVLGLWFCIYMGLNIDSVACSPIRAAFVLTFTFFYIGVITAFPLEIAVIFAYLGKRLWLKIVVGISVLLGTALAAYLTNIMLVFAVFAGW